jgi:Family of unknown function (DUF6134)
MAPRGVLSLLAAMLMAAACPGASADDAGEYTFTVLRDGQPVGRHRFAFECQGNRIEIEEATTIEVRLAMIPINAFEHRAYQVWENGRAVLIDATTNDNGEKFDIAVRPSGEGYIRTVNGRVDTFDGSTAVLAFWNKDILRHQAFFSVVEDKVLDATFRFVGQEEIALADGRLEADHYRMVGDKERDLWFDRAGRVVKVAFRRHGSQLEYVRDQISTGECEAACIATC